MFMFITLDSLHISVWLALFCTAQLWLKTVAIKEHQIMCYFCCQNYRAVLMEVWG
jgi:hypothetical protein